VTDKVVLTRRYRISAMHSLENIDLTPEQNREIFGPCYRLHGHDYKIDVSVSGKQNKKSGMVVDRSELDHIVSESLVKPFDKKNLNHAFRNTSGEALSLEFFEILNHALPEHIQLVGITVIETHRNTFEATAV
jgi:6-pyruvoyltetrahydropterin/6-carboxytetrahydropterin synthase